MATKLEFDVEMSCSSCSDAVRNVLKDVPGINNVVINQQEQQVFVETSLPSSYIQEKIESTNRKAVLKGLGSTNQSSKNLGAAVAAISSSANVFGVIRFVQIDENKCIIDGTIDGLEPGEHGFHIYEYGDLSDGYNNLGAHFNPNGNLHGAPHQSQKHVGDLGNLSADDSGRATFRFDNDAVKVWDIIGRSIGISDKPNTFNAESNGNCENVVAGGIIARSAGLFENPKRVCVCSGMTIWDERDVAQRQQSKI